jgi:cell division protein FtsZ
MGITHDSTTRVIVVGVGGGGSATVARMLDSGVTGVEFASLDLDPLTVRRADLQRIPLREPPHRGFHFPNPDHGRMVAEENADWIAEALGGATGVIVVATLGGATGTGAAPVVARIARDGGSELTLAVVTTPFAFEGRKRIAAAEAGRRALRATADACFAMSLDLVPAIQGTNLSLKEAFEAGDSQLAQAAEGLCDVLASPTTGSALADIREMLPFGGEGFIGVGQATGHQRAAAAARAAILSLERQPGVRVQAAHRVLISVTGGPDVLVREVNEAAEVLGHRYGDDANLSLLHAGVVERLAEAVRVTVFGSCPGLVARIGRLGSDRTDLRR